MRTKPTLVGVTSVFMLIVPFASNVFGAEGGLGRPISGATINPYAGLVPPLPGFAVGITEAYYAASIAGSTTVPIGTNLTLGLDMKASFTPITILYIWPTQGKEWNLASAFSIPIAYVEAEATVTVGRRTGRVKDDNFGVFDIILVPIIASYHISETDHFAFNFTVWAPSGDYD